MDSRQRLIDAAQDLLWQHGYTATSPRAILAAAGAGQGSMYHHFAGKTELAAEALRASADAMRREAEALLTGPESAFDRLTAYLTRQRDSLRGCRIGRMTYDAQVLAEAALLEPVQATFTWLVEALRHVVREAQTEGDVRPDLDADEVASAIAATVQGGYVLARAQSSPEPFERAVRGALAMLRHARP